LASTPATYTVTYAFGGICPSSATFDVTITTAPEATFSYGGSPYCPSGADPSPVFGAGASAGAFSAEAGLVIDPTTGVIDLDASAAGSYTVTNTIAAVGTCPEVTQSVAVEILPTDDPAFNFSQTAYCQDETNPVAIISGTVGGTFSSTAGLTIDAVTGEVDLTASTPGTYTVTYATAGSCPASADVSITINAVPDPTFSYASGTFCQDAGPQLPTVTQIGGVFSASSVDLALDTSTGEIDPFNSPAGTYDITYEIAGACSRSSTFTVTISGVPNATFSYNDSPYCQSDTDPVPVFATGASPGNFSAPAGLVIDPTSGVIDLDASIPGTYTVTNDIPAFGICVGATATFDVIINGTEDASFSYSQVSYCQDETDPIATITGVTGGSFAASPAGLVFADVNSGAIDLDASLPGVYTVTYTSPGSCFGSFDQSVTISAMPVPDFSYATASMCQSLGSQLPVVSESGGTFSSTAGLIIDPVTGEIDPAASTVGGPYTVTYMITNGAACTSSATFDVNITDILVAPAGLTVSAASCSGFTAGWAAVPGAVQYRIEASSDNFVTVAESATIPELTYTFTSLSVETRDYELRVVAVDACGADGVASAEVAAQTSPSSACGCGFDQASFVVSSENVNCPGSEDGALMVYVNPTATAALSRFEYRYESALSSTEWISGGNFPGLVFLADNLAAGDYTVMVRDRNAQTGCDSVLTFSRTIGVQNPVTLSSSPESCEGNDGSITVNLTASCTEIRAYEIIGSSLDTGEPMLFTGTTANGLSEGSYEIVLRDDLGTSLDTLYTTVISTCSTNGGGGPGITCVLGDKTVDVDVTPASCESGEGSVTFTVVGGETDNYNFRIVSVSGVIDETQAAIGSATFNNLPAGEYDYIVIDEAGTPRCESSFRVVENIVVINTISFELPSCDAPSQTATLDVMLSAATNAPAPYDVYVINGTDTVSVGLIEAGTSSTQVGGVPTGGDYRVVIRSRGAQSCPASRVVNIPETGMAAISFDYEASNITCFGDGGTVTVNNIVVAENTEFTINIMSVNQSQPYMSRIFSAIPSSYTFANLEKGDYRVQIVQQQASCGIISTESSPTFTVDGADAELTAAVPETVFVTVNEPYGNILIDSISGGGKPYEVRIAADPNGGTTDWITVDNANPAIDPYAYEFRDLEMGTYFIELRDRFGCSQLYEVSIRYTAELYIPNIITPNGDGDNDTFRIINLESGTGDSGARMIISNRWGRVIYQSENYTNDKAWDGGESADGMYFYDLRLPDGSQYRGWIEIWRGRTP
jgi:gliding motility-associated-like protein